MSYQKPPSPSPVAGCGLTIPEQESFEQSRAIADIDRAHPYSPASHAAILAEMFERDGRGVYDGAAVARAAYAARPRPQPHPALERLYPEYLKGKR